MSWLAEAQKIISTKPQHAEAATETTIDVSSPQQVEALTKELRSLYENATLREIERAIGEAQSKLSHPYNRKEFMAFLRTKLED